MPPYRSFSLAIDSSIEIERTQNQVFECNQKYEFFNLADKPIIMILSRPLALCSDWDILSRLNFLLTAILFIRSCLQSEVITIRLLRRERTPWRESMRSAEKIIIGNYVLIENKISIEKSRSRHASIENNVFLIFCRSWLLLDWNRQMRKSENYLMDSGLLPPGNVFPS